jgi:hypothetical protein
MSEKRAAPAGRDQRDPQWSFVRRLTLTIYGTLVLMSEIAYLGDKNADALTGVTVVGGTAGVLFLAHVYAEVLASAISHTDRPRLTRLRQVAFDSVPLLLVGIVPVSLLALSAAGGLALDPIVNLCLWLGSASLAIWGFAAARLTDAGRFGTPVLALTTLAVGLVIVVLKGLFH